MKYIHITMMVLATLLITSCSPDIEEDGGKGVAIIEESPWPPEPHWADGTITIEIGQYHTGKQMVDWLNTTPNFHAYGPNLRLGISQEDFPMSWVPKEVEITVLTLGELGVAKDAAITLTEVRSLFRRAGYRPLTLEEAVMTRICFTDQPDIKKTDHKMTRFRTLLSQKDGRYLYMPGDEKRERTLCITRNSGRDQYGEGYMLSFENTERSVFGWKTGFAVVKK
ncbi:MAG: hypothetical protein OXI43_13210 [Candidatus Poribacteria bacterium]|nr:hypothetical protein [Candidatus Poribacteria bacterium]